MIGKTSIFLSGAIATIFLVSFIGTQNAEAFEPTKKEMIVIEKLVKLHMQLEKTDKDTREYKETKIIYDRVLKITNDMGIFIEGQNPTLDHLTKDNTSTRQAAQAGVEPIEPKVSDDEESNLERNCCNNPKTMYVQSGYKDPYVFLGFTLYDYYAGNPSANISSGQTAAIFEPQWNGLNQGIIPYCYTSSLTQAATATYSQKMFMIAVNNGPVLINSAFSSESSYFVWYDPFDRFDYATQNNVDSGPKILCTITNVSVS